ncbi:Ubiquitin family protein [Tritrichomonas foetus]|uniref:Ubiquitin family protein n=1 Tax=Tritrichomonas foetus TaxID=1144522 RepID=A0A1J4J9Z4_9EUKA|nr:Ubiquitin family protein [Tritrichomonas foetus]|eukprot:OHS95976.1 Ubiquitin family protein [Tritrichomonas foetus]
MLDAAMPSRLINFRIKRNDGSGFNVEFDMCSTVLSLKDFLANKTGYLSEQIRLVFSGQVLKDEMSLSYYKITTGSQIYFVPIIRKTPPHQKPYQLLNKMMQLLDKLPNASSSEYSLIVDEVNEILENPSVQSFSRINPDIEQLFLDAKEIIAHTERPISSKSKYFLAKAKDQVYDQFDQSPDGLRILQSFMEETEAYEDEFSNNQYSKYLTNIHYKKSISSQPLPDPWNNRRRKKSIFHNTALRLSSPSPALFFKEIPRTEENLPLIKVPTFESSFSFKLKSKFADQVAVLKKKGFNDENIILQALSETDGNIQLAEQLLRSKFR